MVIPNTLSKRVRRISSYLWWQWYRYQVNAARESDYLILSLMTVMPSNRSKRVRLSHFISDASDTKQTQLESQKYLILSLMIVVPSKHSKRVRLSHLISDASDTTARESLLSHRIIASVIGRVVTASSFNQLMSDLATLHQVATTSTSATSGR